MKEQEKQIAGLMKDLRKIHSMPIPMLKGLDSWAPELAEELIKLGWVKLSEDSVVLTETERITMSVKQWDKGYAQASKNIAEKIYKEYLCDILSPEAKEEFAKQFSVHIRK